MAFWHRHDFDIAHNTRPDHAKVFFNSKAIDTRGKGGVVPVGVNHRTMLDFFEALIRAGAGEKYFENPATLSFVIAPLLRTVKMITEVTYSKDIIIDNVNVNNVNIVNAIAIAIAFAIVTFIAIDNVINTAHFENFLQRWIFPAANFVLNFQKKKENSRVIWN